jgi:hypothetical protein
MTESDIGSGSHREPSSATLEIAKLKERHIALKADVGELGDTMAEIKGLLIGYIQTSDSRHAQLLQIFNDHAKEDAVAHQKVLSLEQRAESLEADKKGWTGIGLGLGGAAAGIWALIKSFAGGSP